MIQYILDLLGVDAAIISSDGAFFVGSLVVVTSFVFVVKGIFSFFNSIVNRY